MRRRAKVRAEVGIVANGSKRMRRSTISVLANQFVDPLVFTELMHSGREDDELSVVGQCHARAIYRLVADPCGMELTRIEKDNRLVDLFVERLEIDLEAELRSGKEALNIVTDEKATDCEAAALSAPNYRMHIDNW